MTEEEDGKEKRVHRCVLASKTFWYRAAVKRDLRFLASFLRLDYNKRKRDRDRESAKGGGGIRGPGEGGRKT